jgi:hypothetical protein
MELHARTFYVEGINLGDERFIWNDKLMFMDAGTKSGNVAEVHVLINRPIMKSDEISRNYLDQHHIDTKEGKHILSIFLACYRLSIERMHYPKINDSMSGGHPIKNIEDFRTYKRNNNPFVNCKLEAESIEDNIRDLKNTIPLFEKVMKHIQFNQKKANPLLIALPLYQRITGFDIEDVIDYCTILESLVCENESELKFKFALRTALLIEMPDMDRKEVFEFLKNVYNIRSRLVHGTEISLQMYSSENTNIIFNLQNIVAIALVEYIELVNSGFSKKQIIEKLDHMALETP